jgi:CRISPR system Cascade subunit CasA
VKLENRFNLIDEPWIPIVDVGRVSLRQLFSHLDYRALGGNPREKIALTKLLLAIAQSACTPNNDEDWNDLGVKGLSEKCLDYLESWYDRFWLYGERPFLQMPAIASAELKSFGAVLPEIVTGNTTILKESQVEKPLSDADKALLVLSLMGFAVGGKADNKVILSEGYKGKKNDKGNIAVGSPGPFLGSCGLLHSFLLCDSLLRTILINLFTKKDIAEKFTFIYPEGLGVSPWEKMPEGEDCLTANSLQKSLMGKLVPLAGFCLLTEDKIHYSEGIKYPDYKEGGIDPSIAIDSSGKIPKVLWVDPEKRPWRYLTAFLSLVLKDGFDCYQINLCLSRVREIAINSLGIWSGGLKVSGGKTKKQYVSGNDDFVDSTILLPIGLYDKSWYEQLKFEMKALDELSNHLYTSTLLFFKSQKMDGKKNAKAASHLFWQLCERNFKKLLIACNNPEDARTMRKTIFKSCVNKAYDLFCPKETVRQLDAWAKNRPNPKKYLGEQTKVSHE